MDKEHTCLSARFIYTGLRVKNMDESIRFYTEVLGMEIAEKRERTRAPSSHVTRIVMVDKNGNYLKYADKHTHCSAR